LRAVILYYTGSPDRIDARVSEVLAEYEVIERVEDSEALARCEVLMTWPSRPNRELLKKLKRLRMIQSLAAGVDALDFTSLPPGVQVFSNAGAYTESAAEHAWGLALGIAKGVHAGRLRLPPRHLRSGTLAVVGCGAIGCEIARLARTSLEMTTIGVSRSFKIPELFDEVHPIEDLKNVIGRSDLVVDALPLTKLTRGIFDYDVLASSKPTVVLVNIGRGETVNENALSSWLKERQQSRYATDVFWKRNGKEVFDTPLWDLPNFGGTIHTASAQDPEAIVKAQVAAAKNVRLFLETGSAANRIIIEEYLP
jgi:phosphoglycerate dehydrogenase-like enzyme